MTSNRLCDPVAAAHAIIEEYHKDLERRLKSFQLSDDLTNQIVTDIYVKDDIYFSLNRTYERIEVSFAEYCRQQNLHSSLPEMFPTLGKLYKHQAQAIESIQEGQTTIISTGTGSGKTEAFLIPILHYCLEQKGIPGIKAVILYPLNALANDQLRRIIEAVKDRGIRVGCFVGSTSYDKSRTANDIEELCISRREMIEFPPDILVTNYVMLDRLITNPGTHGMFLCSAGALKYLVVDEVHYFRGTKGANLSLLLRRLRTFCKQSLVQIGASGTLRRGGGYFPDNKQESIERFARLIFGNEAIESKGVRLVEPAVKSLELKKSLEALPLTDVIEGDPFLDELDLSAAEKLYEQLSGKLLEKKHVGNFANNPMYLFAMRSQFVMQLREQLQVSACTFNEFVTLFCELFREVHGKEPREPRRVVEAYWSLINYLNQRCVQKKIPLVLDYRLHIILGDPGDELTRCLLCGRYYDGRCPKCRHCNNGLLFKVSKDRPDLCIAYLTSNELFPDPPPGRPHFPVFVQISPEKDFLAGATFPRLQLDLHVDIAAGEESYRLFQADDNVAGIIVKPVSNKKDLKVLSLSEPRMYWDNVLKILDALVLNPEKSITKKLLGFIDNRERASAIKLRLSDEIADRTLTGWAASALSGEEEMNLIQAFDRLKKAITSYSSSDEEDSGINDLLREMPFWFTRMLGSLDEYEEWKVVIHPASPVQTGEEELLNILLFENAIDRTYFWEGKTDNLKYFHLEKYRVSTQYAVGLSSTDERGYNIKSLGVHGLDYKDYIMHVGSTSIQQMLERLVACGVLIRKETPKGISFYQLLPEHLLLKLQVKADLRWQKQFATIECHTADLSDASRSQIEARFSKGEVTALICTPTLEMGVDIGDLAAVLMVGFPPSPANYAQRAGRAGRSSKNRLATVVVLSSSVDPHDEYYYAIPCEMIVGQVTPPQFTLANFALLAAHVYAYLSANAEKVLFLSDPVVMNKRIQIFLEQDDLYLRSELGAEEYGRFSKYLAEDSQKVAARLKDRRNVSSEYCYRQGIFPDYGFRSDGLPLLKSDEIESGREDEVDRLTAREPEEAPRKLVPGRIVFCGGRAIKVAENQPDEAYYSKVAPDNKVYRLYHYVVSDEKEEVHIEKHRHIESLYRMSRWLDMRYPLEKMVKRGPLYCCVYFVHRGVLYFINEGKKEQGSKPVLPLSDHKGDYRFGTCLERDGLLIRFADRILPPNMKVNFLAALLRGIPNYLALDDSELRLAQQVQLYPRDDLEAYQASNYFLYGHDESGLVPVDRIFENLKTILGKTLDTLEHCSCGGSGCYLCLFSLNSRVLAGRLSSEEAVNSLAVFLGRMQLKPYIEPAKKILMQPDVILSLVAGGNQCRVTIQSMETGRQAEYTRNNPEEDHNTRLYSALHEALEREWHNGARTVRIRTNIEYVRKQLLGENAIENGREAFLALRLTLLKWQNWEIERG